MYHGTRASPQCIQQYGLVPKAEATHSQQAVNDSLFLDWHHNYFMTDEEKEKEDAVAAKYGLPHGDEERQKWHDQQQADANKVWADPDKEYATAYTQSMSGGVNPGGGNFHSVAPSQTLTIDDSNLQFNQDRSGQGYYHEGAIPPELIQASRSGLPDWADVERLIKGVFDEEREHPPSQHTLPMHDESLDETEGWTGVKPVTEYHGTTDSPGVNVGGLEGKVMSRHRAVKPPAGLEGEPVVYTTSDKEKAREWAKQRAKTLGTDPAKVGVYGVRGGDLESTEQEDSKSQFGGATTRVHSPNIPRERMTVVKQFGLEDYMRWAQEGVAAETDDSLDVGTGVSMEENDPCCEEVKRQMAVEWPDDDDSFLTYHEWLDCNSLRQTLQDLGADWDGVNPHHAGRYLQMWDECEAASHPTDDPLFTAGHGSAGVLVKQYGQEPSFETRQVEEAPPETDESLDVGTGVGMKENDPCCEEARTAWLEYLTQYSDTVPGIGYSWFMEDDDDLGHPPDANQNCEELRESIEVWSDNNWGTNIAPTLDEIPPKILQEWDACAGQQFSGDTFTAGHGSAGVLVSKHAESPEAKRHKYQYDKKYMSTPERIKYREDLNRERRKRGIYGRGGPDMSHTKRGTLVAEDPHANRARHFKGRGTLKSVGVRKSNNPDDYANFQEVLQNLPRSSRRDFDDAPEDEMRAAMDAIRSKNPNINWKRPPPWVFEGLIEALGPAQQARVEEKNRIAEQARQIREAQSKTHWDLVEMLAGTTEAHPNPTVQAALSEMRDHIHNTTQPNTDPCEICSGNEWEPQPEYENQEQCTACGNGRDFYHEGFAEELLESRDAGLLEVEGRLYNMPEDAQNYQAIMQMAADKMQKSVGVRKMTEEEAWALEEQMLGREGSSRRLKEPRGRRRRRSEGIKVTDSQDWGKIKEARRDKAKKRSVDRELFSQPTGTSRKRSLVTSYHHPTSHPGYAREEVYREHQLRPPIGSHLPKQGPTGALRSKFYPLKNPGAPLGLTPSDETDIGERENEEGKPVMTMGPVYEEFSFNELIDEAREAQRQWDKNAARMGLSDKPEAPLVTSPYAHRFDEEGRRQEPEPALSEQDALYDLEREAVEDSFNTALAGNTPHYLLEEHESGLVPTFRGLPERTASQSMFGVPFIRSESPAPKLVGVKKANDML